MGSLTGKVALVTGAAKRIGRDVALGLAAEGADCLVHYNRSAAEAEAVAEECRALGVRAETLAANLEREADTRALAVRAAERGCDILVHNASRFDRVPFLESDVATHAAMLARDWAVHVSAPYALSRALGERMVAQGYGRIVLFGDWSTEVAAYRNYAPYVVSKGAVPTLAKVLALELGSRSPGVTVNAVLPGPILPPEGLSPDEYEIVRRQTVLGRWAGTADVVRTVLFFVAAENVTGTSLRVDGGRALKAI